MVMDMMTDTVNLIDASDSEIVLYKKHIGEKTYRNIYMI